jgi:hypothetical protein
MERINKRQTTKIARLQPSNTFAIRSSTKLVKAVLLRGQNHNRLLWKGNSADQFGEADHCKQKLSIKRKKPRTK